MPHTFYAHSLPGRPQSEWETMAEHEERVGALCREFLEWIDPSLGAWGELLGRWHDLGKYQPAFQAYLRSEHPGVEHAGVGAVLAQECARSQHLRDATAICFVIAGHHTGLANARSNESAESFGDVQLPTSLRERLKKNQPVFDVLRATIPSALLDAHPPGAAGILAGLQHAEFKSAFEFWTRILFAALVDADRLATAKFYSRFEPTLLHEDLRYENLEVLRDRLDQFLDALRGEAKPTPVNRLRGEVLDACRAAAYQVPGRFSMTVPTGGGKTLSAMSFALRHAVLHGLRRVIVVIPYTSIIEQNAKVYRDVLGADNVLEHHSNLDEAKLEEIEPEREARRKLAAENWDAPVVVTTSVQFFESLFSNHPSRCRKLHNIAKSIVILDEVQTLLPQLLEPILDGLRELTERYGCSVVFSTATPPALVKRRCEQRYGLTHVREMIPDPADVAKRARRVRIHWEVASAVAYATLAERLAEHDKVLVIVHRRRDARDLAEFLGEIRRDSPVFHLSALMCPAHRLSRLKEIREALEDGVCRVVATQLVEAGVDLDFPVVYRALSGVDSLTQAAGRCDREGKLTAALGGQPGGTLVVFRPPTLPPPGVLRKAMESTVTLLGLRADLDPFSPETCEAYFHELYGKHDLDDRSIQRDRRDLNFATVALKFRMIDGAMQSIVVPYRDAMDRVAAFRAHPSRKTQRALQPFLVQVSQLHHATLNRNGALETVHDRVDILAQPYWNRYDEVRFGLDPGIDGVMDPELTIC